MKKELENVVLSVPEARQILNGYRERQHSEGEELPAPDDFLGTAAAAGLLGNQAEQFFLHTGLNFLTQRENLIGVEFRHRLIVDFFVGIELGRTWSDLPQSRRLEVIRNDSWWDAIIYMISISNIPRQRLEELEELRDQLAPGILSGLALSSMAVLQKKGAGDSGEGKLLKKYQAEFRTAIARFGLLPEYRSALSLMARWVPLQFADFMVSFFGQEGDLTDNVLQEIFSWFRTSPVSLTIYITLRAMHSGNVATREMAQSVLLASLERLPISAVELKLLMGLLTDPNTFPLVFPICVELLIENPILKVLEMVPEPARQGC